MVDAHRSDAAVAAGLRVLLEDILDYAGMFPPASLSLNEAIKNFSEYRQSAASWMLGRFVVPAANLVDLHAHAALFEQNPPFRFSLLVGRGEDAASFLAAADDDMQSADEFRRQHGDLVRIEAIEMRMPAPHLMTDVVTAGRFLGKLDSMLERTDMRGADLFVEIPLDQTCRQSASIVAGALHSLNRNRTAGEHGIAGLKMRTGGTSADSIPEADHLATAIVAAGNAAIPFKATAGLHHPVRHFDEKLGTEMHGFLNVFVAGILASSEPLDEAVILSILREKDAGAFSFGHEGVAWNGHRASLEAVARARRDVAVSFGSCSFSEPIEDLHALGLL